MGVAEAKPFLTVEEYLEGEKHSEIKHEYLGGEVYAMAGASRQHNLISLNLAAALRAYTQSGPCQVFMADMMLRLKVLAADVFYYPDLMVGCDPADTNDFYLERPTVIVEVLSDSTERTDRREKLWSYLTLDSLQTYLLVSQRRPEITVYERAAQWHPLVLGINDTLALPALGFSAAVAAAYEGLLFKDTAGG